VGKRGPKPGFKKAAAQAATTKTSGREKKDQAPAAPVSAADRENPDKLSGEALRVFAHRRGLAKSAIADMADEKIRQECRLITYRQYEAA
jgi:hypothetical protein